jgi:hypothetical protein
MIKHFSDTRYQHFTCFGMCIGGTMAALLGLAFLVMSGFTFNPRWLYIFVLFLMIGFALDLVSKPLLWIRVCQIIAMLLATISFPAFLLYDLYNDFATTASRYFQITSTFVVLSILISIIWAFVQTLCDPKRTILPHGALGRLDIQEGIVYPEQMPNQTPKKLLETQARTRAGLQMVSRYTPIIAAIAMLSVRAFSSFDVLQMLKPMLLLVAVFYAYGVGSYSAYYVSIRRWENIHQKKVYVKL